MPQVEPPYIIAVIREKEKGFLGENEITRMMHATSLQEAREVLMSTPYAVFLTGDVSVRDGLYRALEAEYLWLEETIDSTDAIAFIGARYDVLHIAQGIIVFAKREPHMPNTNRLGTLSHATLQEMIFTPGYTDTKDLTFWLEFIATQKEAIKNNAWSMPFLFDAMQHMLEERLAHVAFTPFMRVLALHAKSHHERDIALRSSSSFTEAMKYEWEWDANVVALAREKRHDPTGYDPIIAYWLLKEMEVKTITLIFAALTGGFSKEETTSLIRPLARV